MYINSNKKNLDEIASSISQSTFNTNNLNLNNININNFNTKAIPLDSRYYFSTIGLSKKVPLTKIKSINPISSVRNIYFKNNNYNLIKSNSAFSIYNTNTTKLNKEKREIETYQKKSNESSLLNNDISNSLNIKEKEKSLDAINIKVQMMEQYLRKLREKMNRTKFKFFKIVKHNNKRECAYFKEKNERFNEQLKFYFKSDYFYQLNKQYHSRFHFGKNFLNMGSDMTKHYLTPSNPEKVIKLNSDLVLSLLNEEDKDLIHSDPYFFLKDNKYLYKLTRTKFKSLMNKFREEKYNDKKNKIRLFQQTNTLPKMLYSNKFLDNDDKKYPVEKTNSKNNNNLSINNNKFIQPYKNKSHSIENKSYENKELEKAITTRNLEEKSKSHVKKTMKIFEDLLHYVDEVEIPLRIKKDTEPLKLTEGNLIQKDISFFVDKDKSDEEEENAIEKYNFDEFKSKYKKEKLNKVSSSYIKATESQKIYANKGLQSYDNISSKRQDQKIYMTNDDTQMARKKLFNSNSEKREKKDLKIATLISDDLLLDQIKNIGRNYKNPLYFDNYGKFKFTNQGLNYPYLYNKYKKIPDYQGKDTEEKEVFKYRSDVIYPKYNYTNIGTFNEKFNKDLSIISTSYGKEDSKGRFILNPLISFCRKYIPEYDQYKNIKSIENKYNCRNKFKFKLKPLVNNRKNNFDKLAKVIYQKDCKKGISF